MKERAKKWKKEQTCELKNKRVKERAKEWKKEQTYELKNKRVKERANKKENVTNERTSKEWNGKWKNTRQIGRKKRANEINY